MVKKTSKVKLDFPIKTEWDLTGIFPTDEEAGDIAYQNLALSEVSKFSDKWSANEEYLNDPEVFLIAVKEYERIVSLYAFGGKYRLYFYLKFDLFNLDEKINAYHSKAKEFGTKIDNLLQFFANSISRIPLERQKEFLEDERLSGYKHFLEKQFERARHLLSDPEEKILNLKIAGSYENWKEMVQKFIGRESRGGKNFDQLMAVSSFDKDERKRNKATKYLNDIIEKVSDVAVEELNNVLLNKKIEDELRGFGRPDEESLLNDDIDVEVVDAMINTVVGANELCHRYYHLKAKLAGKEKLAYNEKILPYGKLPDNFTLEEVVEVVDGVFGKLDGELQKIFRETLSRGGVDILPRNGKRGEGYCLGWTLSCDSFILMNFTGKLDDARTLAHEFGHLFNNEYMRRKVSEVNFGTPLSIAEVASTFTEDFVLAEISSQMNSDEERLALIMAKLSDDVSSIFRQVACYQFERKLHKKYREEGFLSKKTIGDLFKQEMSAYLGKSVEVEGFENWWVYWTHIRRYFYVYSYASGMLISKYIQGQVKKNKDFIADVKEFLSAGTSDSPKNIFAKMGIDITDRKFWENGIGEIEKLLCEAEDLAKKLGKV